MLPWCCPARNGGWAQRPKNPCSIGGARRDPQWATLVTIQFPGAARTWARRLEDRAFAASRVADDRTMRTQNTPVIAAQAAAARDWTVSRIRRKPSSGAMHIVRYEFRKSNHARACLALTKVCFLCRPSQKIERIETASRQPSSPTRPDGLNGRDSRQQQRGGGAMDMLPRELGRRRSHEAPHEPRQCR